MNAVDLFAGAGGFTLGAERAGIKVLACGNHWRTALDIHQQNHPNVNHICANLLELDMGRLPAHDLLLASPACQGFSEASQPTRRPKHEADRNTAWAVIACAEAHRPATILVENVPRFAEWTLFALWRACLERLGYIVRVHIFDAADFGVPQTRRRLIVSARRGHALDLVAPQTPHRAFATCIDWESPGEGRGWEPIAKKPAGVRRRYAAARARHLGQRFLLHYDSYHRGRSLARPIGTITTKDQWALVDGPWVRMLTRRELMRAQSFPVTYALPTSKALAVRLLGNAIPPRLAESLCRQAKEPT